MPDATQIFLFVASIAILIAVLAIFGSNTVLAALIVLTLLQGAVYLYRRVTGRLG